MGSSARDDTFINNRSKNTPGPGNYDINLKNNGGWKFGQDERLKYKAAATPGPGAYNDEKSKILDNTPHWKIGSSGRDDGNYLNKTQIQNPGPGTYNYSPVKNSGIKFGKDDRLKGYKSVTPGPGQYNADETKIRDKTPGWKLGSAERDDAFNLKHSQDIPGPGNYDINLKNNGGWKFGKDEKLKQFKTITPGPGAYEEATSIVKDHAPGWKYFLKF
jgi:hypothetical protein